MIKIVYIRDDLYSRYFKKNNKIAHEKKFVYSIHWSSMLFNFVLYLTYLTFLDSGVTDESFVDETRVWRKYKI